ncbi:MAG: PD40 domain-containing protein, partial [Bacteroidetes bacterium]|nr:PD40 domain-containing protein [Bacteroidota bacterium]
MKTRIIITLLTSFLFFAGINLVFSQSAEQLYQKGLMQEEGEGNLEEAIKIFAGIVEIQNADQSLQAKALLHVGLCYEKLGKEEATKAYRRLVDNFPAQKNEIAIAKERLKRLILIAEKIVKMPKVLTNKKIWDDAAGNLQGAPSPDGKYLSYVDWDTGDLAIYEIATGKKRRVTNKGTWDESDEFAEFSRWSPDSKQIVYDWFNEDKFIEIRIVDLDGSKPRTLYKNKGIEWIQTYDWSQDGKYILSCFTSEKANQQIVLISVADGSEHVLKTFDLKWPHGMNFSPDGRYIVYDFPKKKDSENRDIFLMSVDEKKEIPLIEDPATDLVLGWAPDGGNVIFVSDRTGSPDIWGIKVVNGQPQGIPQIVKSNKGPFSPTGLGFTKDGSFYYGNKLNRTDVYTTEIDPVTGKIIVPPNEVIRHHIESNGTPAYSYDGKYLAYVSRRSAGAMRFTTNPTGDVLCIRSLETGEEKEFRPKINVFGWPRWSPEGNSVIVVNWDVNGEMGYYQINTQTGKTTPILLTEGRNLFGGHGWSPDGNTFYYGLRDDNIKKYQIIVRNINSGKVNVVYQSEYFFRISLSPDGKLFALLSDRGQQCLKTLPITGGESRELFKIEEGQEFEFRHSPVSWTTDGKYILFAIKNTKIEDSKSELCRISVNDGELEKLGLKMEGGFAYLSTHPDGKHITFSSSGKLNYEVWKLDNFLPLDKLAQKEEVKSKEPEEIRIRQIWKAPYLDDLGTVSLDGKYRSYVDWGVGNVGIHNLMTDEKKVLTSDAKLGEAWQFAGSTVISRDGKKIVYSWANPYNTNSLRLINVENPEPELLYKKTGEELYPSAWLSDKEIVAFRSIPDNRIMQLVTFNIMDKKIKVKKTFLPGQFGGGACSPDKKYIAYGFANSADKGNTDIRLLEVNGDRDIPLITHPSNDKVLGWVPGRKEFLFISDRSGSWDLWAIKLDGTKPSGPAKRIYVNIGEVDPMGFTRDGECYFGFSRRNFYSGLAPLNKETGEIDLRLGQSFESQNFGTTWSPDGQHLAYIKIEDNSKDNPLKLFVQDIKTGGKFQPENNMLRVSSYSWSPDGNSILVIGREINKLQEKDYKGGIFMVDIKTGQFEKILLLSEYEFNRPEDDSAP